MTYRLFNRIRSRAFRISLAMAALAVTLIMTATSAPAQVIFTLNSVNLIQGSTPAGTLTGTFELNNALTQILTYNIVASNSPGQTPFVFPGETYTPADSTVSFNGLSQASPNFQIDVTSPTDQLRLVFTSLTATGGTLSNTSFESESGAGTRTVVSGTVATPEPSAWVLGLLALAVIGVMHPMQRAVSALAGIEQ